MRKNPVYIYYEIASRVRIFSHTSMIFLYSFLNQSRKRASLCHKTRHSLITDNLHTQFGARSYAEQIDIQTSSILFRTQRLTT